MNMFLCEGQMNTLERKASMGKISLLRYGASVGSFTQGINCRNMNLACGILELKVTWDEKAERHDHGKLEFLKISKPAEGLTLDLALEMGQACVFSSAPICPFLGKLSYADGGWGTKSFWGLVRDSKYQ